MESTIRIERYADQGRCVGHIDGRVVFVRFALPGELVNGDIVVGKACFKSPRLFQSLRLIVRCRCWGRSLRLLGCCNFVDLFLVHHFTCHQTRCEHRPHQARQLSRPPVPTQAIRQGPAIP